ncbi:MAG: ABC transporter ATP-binding protein [Candidatus Pacebacteria bacterium]|nr:ABC transporter ATP-binding protein [Candidatus Paceibacterota bacterium]
MEPDLDADQKTKLASPGVVFRTYWQTAKRYPGTLLVVFGSVIVMQLANLATPLFLREFFNVISSGTRGPAVGPQLTSLVSIVLLLSLLNWLMTRAQGLALTRVEPEVMQELYSKAFNYLLGHSYSFFISNFAGTLTHRVNKFVRAFELLLDAIVLQFFPTMLFVVGAVIVLSLHNLVLGLGLGVWAVLFVLLQITLAKRRQPLRVRRAEADSRVTGALADAISNQSAIQLFSGKTFEETSFASIVHRWHQASVEVWYADEFIWASLALFFVAINIGLLYGAVIFWQRGELTVGDFILIQSYLLTAFNQLLGINRELRRFNDSFADASEMVAILETPHEVRDVPEAKTLVVTHGELAFENVTFYFREEGNPVLDQFTMRVPPHQKLALVGRSGAGKSTITRLLLRLFEVKSGRITIDGNDIMAVTQDSLHDAIAFVPQEPILFHRTLLENIRYGRRDATDEEVYEAARKAHCHEFISQLPDGYQTYVGERGVKLSGGERQRVAIARAILKNAPILMLDEATSSLDSESESLIQDALAVLMQGKTVIVIAHRLSTIMKMDRILVLENGRIVADGTHDELLKSGGLYQKLWNIQAGGFLMDEEKEVEDAIEMQDSEDEGKEPLPPIAK